MTAAVVIYLIAGIGFCWAIAGKWWQRVPLIVAWLPMIAWGMFVQLSDWWQQHGYYKDFKSGNGRPDTS